MVSGDGETVVRVDYEEGTRVWSLNVRTSQHTFKERYKLKAAIETPDVLGFDASGKSLILAWRSDEDAAQGVSDESLYSLEVEGSDPPKKWREKDFDDPVRDPQTDAERVKAGHEQYLVVVGVCTHLGCVPTFAAGDYGGDG